ncbi:MAG: hypothetical protein OXI26_07480 [bacterium]|nr:hypothetical protein [bacterium]
MTAASEVALEDLRHGTILAARAAGASWADVASALGIATDEAQKVYTRVAWRRLDAAANLNLDVSDAEANDLAVRVISEERLGLPLP